MQSVLVTLLLVLMPMSVFAHGGRTNSAGCHNNTKTGDYHCHNSGVSEQKESSTNVRSARTSARNLARTSFRDYDCADFEYWIDAQDFYEEQGGPMIDPHDLDRDRDGDACENLY